MNPWLVLAVGVVGVVLLSKKKDDKPKPVLSTQQGDVPYYIAMPVAQPWDTHTVDPTAEEFSGAPYYLAAP